MDKYIKLDDAITTLHKYFPLSFDRQDAEDDLKSIPAADVEEVIRCKNCQFARFAFSAVDDGIFTCARTGLNLFKGNGYCSWAELAIDRPIKKEKTDD